MPAQGVKTKRMWESQSALARCLPGLRLALGVRTAWCPHTTSAGCAEQGVLLYCCAAPPTCHVVHLAGGGVQHEVDAAAHRGAGDPQLQQAGRRACRQWVSGQVGRQR